MKRIISLLLALLMLSACFLTSCSKDKTEEETTDGAVTTNSQEEEETKYLDDLPQKDMGGYEFMLLQNPRQDFVTDTGFGDNSDGSVYGDAIYRRNLSVEERFNCVLKVEYNSVEANLIPIAMSGDCEYDMLMFSPVGHSDILLSGALLDWSNENMPFIDKSKPYYHSKMNENLSVAGSQFFLSGEFANSVNRFTYCWYFNSKLLQDVHHMQPDDLYEIVINKQWTYEKAYTMIENTYADDGTLGEKDTADTFGYASNYRSAAVAYNYAFDNRSMLMIDGVPQMNENFYDKSIDVIEAVRKLFYDNKGSYVGDWGADSLSWRSSKALFVASCLHDGIDYANVNFNFGIVPYPLYDSEQTEYYSSVDGAHHLMAMLTSLPDERKENNSIIIEALNAESARISKPVFIEQTLKLRTFNESLDKVDIIVDLVRDSVIADFGYFFSAQHEGFPFMIELVLESQTFSEENRRYFPSLYEQNKDKNINKYNDIVSKLVELSEGE